jgi:hypothetical protein
LGFEVRRRLLLAGDRLLHVHQQHSLLLTPSKMAKIPEER